jgi:hypothetical protein
MSDSSISIVPKQSAYPDREIKSRDILEWLVSLDIVKPTPSDCILESGKGYAISEEARLITNELKYLPIGLATNGLEIITKRQVFDTAENGLQNLTCPNRKNDIADEDWGFLNEWAEGKSNSITCPLCDISSDIHQFEFTPEWGFSDLGFTFWNWPPLTKDFIRQFKLKLGCEVSVVYAHI